MTDTTYNIEKAAALDGSVSLDTDDIRCLLLTGAVTIDPDHATVAAVLAANTEASDISYARQQLANETVTQNDTDDRAEFAADSIDFGALDNETPTAALIFKFDTDDANSTPVSIHDSNFGATANGAGYVIETPNDILRAA